MVSNILKIILKTIKLTFSLSGRASRKEFIIFHIFYGIICFLFVLVDHLIHKLSISIIIFLTILIWVSVFIFIPSIFSLIVRRIHDLNTSAWWLLITLIPLGGLLFFALPFKKGTEGRNKYGEPPEY